MLACEKISDGYTDDKITSVSDDNKINYIAKSLNDMFDKLNIGISNALEVLEEYKEQNYLNKIDSSIFLGGGFKNLFEGINSLQEKITEQVSLNYIQGLKLEAQSKILTQKANSLSESSQEQSVSIEETAAAIVEVNSIMSNNLEYVNQMLDLGTNVQLESKKGSALAKDTDDAMDDINESTMKAFESVNQISQIAFQTNILSLNAAVEAATAGEAGKGFAVVAQEVRNLANKSAEVAKEIESLMKTLQEKTKKGKDIANQMNLGYEDLIKDINKTVEIIHQVSDSSKEQETGISQISDAINQIDQEVQSNAAIAFDVKTVANENNKVSIEIVENSKKIKFIGKEDIYARAN
ncbi:MAG: methyl-accepting chemotaxis protein, partial [Poseidonibacter sp.]|uniref:methyl-accepting chemotaxis protein n=1 Tax=Poseidonibacter sp. TaxID=2321188 RepID=UPI00359EB9A4